MTAKTNTAQKQTLTNADVGDLNEILNVKADPDTADQDGTAGRVHSPVIDFKFRVKKNVTLPLLKIQPERAYYIRVDGEIYKSKPLKNVEKMTAAEKAKEPPMLAEITNLETGEKAQMIFPTVLNTELAEQYPDAAYVGKCFSIIKHEKAFGKSYSTFSIAEIEVE